MANKRGKGNYSHHTVPQGAELLTYEKRFPLHSNALIRVAMIDPPPYYMVTWRPDRVHKVEKAYGLWHHDKLMRVEVKRDIRCLSSANFTKAGYFFYQIPTDVVLCQDCFTQEEITEQQDAILQEQLLEGIGLADEPTPPQGLGHLSEVDLVWLAGVIDSHSFFERTGSFRARKNGYYRLSVDSATGLAEKVHEVTGYGTVAVHNFGDRRPGKSTRWRLQRKEQVVEFLTAIRPYLKIRGDAVDQLLNQLADPGP